MADSLDHLTTGRTRVQWLSNLNTEYKPTRNYRRTSIICTIGESKAARRAIVAYEHGQS